MQLDVERAGADATPVHRAQHLNVADGVKAEAVRDPRLDQVDDPRHGGFGVVGPYEVEVAIACWSGEIGVILCALVMIRL